jgi:hypothetical protein
MKAKPKVKFVKLYGVGFTPHEIRQLPKAFWLELHRFLHDKAAQQTGRAG